MLMFSLAGIPPLAGFFAKFYVFLAAIKAGLYPACRHRRARERGGRLLLSAHRQDHVFRRTGAERFEPMPTHPCARCSASAVCSFSSSSSIRRRLSRLRRRRSEVSVLMSVISSRSPRTWRAATGCIGSRRSARPMPRRGARACRRARAVVDLVARGRSQGRGRRGREWVSQPGNLFASLLLSDAIAAGRGAQLVLLAALSACTIAKLNRAAARSERLRQMAERHSARPARRSPACCSKGESQREPLGRRDRHRRQSARAIPTTPPSRRPSLAAAGAAVPPADAVRGACAATMACARPVGRAARASPPSAALGSTEPAATARRSASAAERGARRPLRRPRSRRAGCRLEKPDGGEHRVTAGDVFVSR